MGGPPKATEGTSEPPIDSAATIPFALDAEWPGNMPKGCPDARQTFNGVLFRRVAQLPATLADEQNLPADVRGVFRNADPCLRSSLSFLDSEERARLLVTASPALGRSLVRLKMSPALGKAERTGKAPGHYSVWLRSFVFKALATYFEAVP